MTFVNHGTTADIYLDATAILTAAAIAGGTTTVDTFAVGSLVGVAATNFCQEDVFELPLYVADQSLTQQQQVRAYLKNKWATP
jgi:hypothetical protein